MAKQDNSIICNVKKYRLGMNWSQEDLAGRIGVKRQAIYDIESGRYLPNTAVALQLAYTFGCKVEDLFIDDKMPDKQPVHVINGEHNPSTRLALARVRDRIVGIPLKGQGSAAFGLRPADGLLNRDGKSVQIRLPEHLLDNTIILMGCDPAFEILSYHVSRAAPHMRVHCHFASSHKAVSGLAQGIAHVAGTHLHNTNGSEANVTLASQKLTGMKGIVLAFSTMEEGLMVAKGNPLGIKSIADLAQPGIRFVNREPGAALRSLLDDHLSKAGITGSSIDGYQLEVNSHRNGAYYIACNAADVALGLRAVAENYELDFVPIVAARCDLVIPDDMSSHPTVKVLMDVLQSSFLRNEIDILPGYEGSVTGKTIATF